MFDGWRREQAVLKRTVSAATAAARGDRAWSSSLGHVPLPRHGVDAEETGLDGDDDDGMDIFDVLNFGPPPDAKR